MTPFVVLGTDTDAGKTTFSLLWLARFGGAYWKPAETGASDTEAVASRFPNVRVRSPIVHCAMPAAPPLAARREGKTIPFAVDLAQARPADPDLLVETFGGAFSPLNETETQIALVIALGLPCVLVGSSALGAVGRALASLHALASHGVVPRAVALIGPRDAYAEATLRQHWPRGPVVSLPSPAAFADADGPWPTDAITAAATSAGLELDAIRAALGVAAPPEDDDWQATDRRCVWHPYTPLGESACPLPVVGADAEFLHLADGRRIVDGISSWWTILHGHRPPELVEALRVASGQIDHVIYAGAAHPWGARLAQRLLGTLGWDGGRVFYSDNGSTAVEAALKLTVQYWRRRNKPRTLFVGFENSYHGDTFGAMAISRDPTFFASFEPMLFETEILPLDPNALDAFLARERERVAGVVIEPLVQAAGGMRMHTPETLRALCEIAHRHGTLFIADEVMTGFGRTGTFWAHQAAGIVPDLMAASKTLAGGLMPLAATFVHRRIAEAFADDDRRAMFFHGHSFTGHPLACAVALANIDLAWAAVPSAPARIEGFLRTELSPLRDLPGVRDVRFRGAVAAVELDLPGGYLADRVPAMKSAALAQGVLLRPLGPVVYALPPWRTSDASLARIAAALRAAVAAGLR